MERAPLEPDAIIDGRYRLVRSLGEGGMGWVWEAVHVFTNKRYALKFLKRAAEEADRRRFEREVRSAAAIKHPNVIDVHDFLALQDGSLVMVMDLLEGETLAAVVARVRRIALPELAAIMKPVFSALEASHALGIVHRDLKPENIFLARAASAEIVVKVLDFGTAKLTADEGLAAQSAALTHSGAVIGTPYYMSPEQVLTEKDVDLRSDIWALGVVMYECLAGVRPTEDENVGRVLKRIILHEIAPLATHCADLPADVLALVDRMLSAERGARPGSAAEVAGVLAGRAASMIPSFAPPAPNVRIPVSGHDVNTDSRGDTQRADVLTVSAVTSPPRRFGGRKQLLAGAVVVFAAAGGAAVYRISTSNVSAVSAPFPSSAGRHPCDDVPRSKADAKGLATMQLVKAPDGSCFWIDKQEVSVEQYRRFLAERGSSTTWSDTKRCGWKTTASAPETDHDACTATLAEEQEPFLASKPIRCVDWCDARETCLWAGKDLCGSPSRFLASEPSDLPDEWGLACSADGQPYPYGLVAERDRCLVGICSGKPLLERCAAARTGSFPSCAGPNGTQDMVGNVSEWVFACDRTGDGGPTTECRHRGGSFNDSMAVATCQGDRDRAARSTRSRSIGLRCCATLTVAEQALVH